MEVARGHGDLGFRGFMRAPCSPPSSPHRTGEQGGDFDHLYKLSCVHLKSGAPPSSVSRRDCWLAVLRLLEVSFRHRVVLFAQLIAHIPCLAAAL